MAKKGDLIYNSETGDVMDGDEQRGVVAIDPLRIPGILENFIAEYVPAESERQATDVIGIGELRTMLNAWLGFGVKEDPLQEYLDILASNGYMIQSTSSGPAMCLIRKDSGRVVNVYEDMEVIG